jgi:ABC-type transporter Mla subunit MlaD
VDLRRHEIGTGLLVLATVGVVTAVLLAVADPGIVRGSQHYFVFFDNVGGMKPGTQVLIAGRPAGEVMAIDSPVAMAARPEGRPDLEVRVELEVEGDAKIYRDVMVRLEPLGLLGDQAIDFVSGVESSGQAPSGTAFVGERVAGITDVSAAANEALAQLQHTLASVNALTLAAGGELEQTLVNARQFTDTLKRQPWRLVWKSTKDYPGDGAADEDKDKDKDKPKGQRAGSRDTPASSR